MSLGDMRAAGSQRKGSVTGTLTAAGPPRNAIGRFLASPDSHRDHGCSVKRPVKAVASDGRKADFLMVTVVGLSP